MLILCKSQENKWVFQQIEQHIKPKIHELQDLELKSHFVMLVLLLCKQFNVETDACVLKNIEIWMKNIQCGKTYIS